MTSIQPVVLSGGAGTRLWPASRAVRPKQFLTLIGGMTLVQHTIRRLAGKSCYSPALIVGSGAHYDIIAPSLADMDYTPGGYIHEPVGRNTAAAVALAAISLEARGAAETVLLVMPADHHIGDEAAFHTAVEAGALAARDGLLVTFGITPDGPETGYGYIVAGKTPCAGGALPVARFLEKPDHDTAAGLIDAGGCYWNSGIFMFRVDSLLAEMTRYCPDILSVCRDALAAARPESGILSPDEALFRECPALPLDIAVMERTDKAVVVPAVMGWSDIGSWNALWGVSAHDDRGNAVRGDVMLEGTSGSYIDARHRLVALVGMEDVVVVETEDAVLVARRDRVQEIKSVVERLKAGRRRET